MTRPQAALLVVTLAAGLAAGRAACRFLPSLHDPGAPLAAARPVSGPSSPRLARRVVLVVVDGLRLDASRGLPFLDRLRRGGASGRAQAPYPTLSAPNHAALMPGVEPFYSGVRTNDVPRPLALDSLPARARAAGLRVVYLSDRSPTIPILFGGHLDESLVGEEPEPRAIARADLVLLVLMEVDRAGHRHGGDADGYREAARALDAELEELLAAVDLARDAVVVTSDHGHFDRGGHGGTGREAQEVPLVLAGAGVRAGALLPDANLVDVAPTVAALLGIPAPGHGTGRALTEALAVSPAAASALAAADADRRARLEPIRRRIEREAREHERAARARRVPVAALCLGVALALAFIAVRRRWLPVSRRAAAVAVAFPVVFYGLVAAFEWSRADPGLSGDALSLWFELAPYGLAALAGHAAAHLLALRGAPSRPALAAGAALVALPLAVAPALAAWAMIGERLLPDPALLMLPPVTAVAAAVHLVTLAVAAGLEGLASGIMRRP